MKVFSFVAVVLLALGALEVSCIQLAKTDDPKHPKPDCVDELQSDDDSSDFVCPHTMPIGHGKKASVQKGFFTKLHCMLIHGNAAQNGTRDHSFRERFFKMYGKELECLYMTYLDDRQEGGPCGGVKSHFNDRQKAWEWMCMGPYKASADVFALMTAKEKLYWFHIKRLMGESQAYTTLLNLAGDKELMCMHMKIIDDECGAFETPRMMPPSEVAKLIKPKAEKDICKGLKFLGADGPCGYGESAKNMEKSDEEWGVAGESVVEKSKAMREGMR